MGSEEGGIGRREFLRALAAGAVFTVPIVASLDLAAPAGAQISPPPPTGTGFSPPPTGAGFSPPPGTGFSPPPTGTGFSPPPSAGFSPPGTASAAPVITSLSPASGPVTGGTTITVTGSGFTLATKVTIAGIKVRFTLKSDTKILAKAPPHAAGRFNVRVWVAALVTPANANTVYTYQPVITSLSPTTGSRAGGNNVVITGNGFTGAQSVHFGALVVTSFTVDSDTQITAVAPPAKSKGVPIVRVVVNGVASPPTPAARYTYT